MTYINDFCVLISRRPGFKSRETSVGFVMEKMALG